jgi:ADP-ribose pyrophosphatase YjhB (NUDIX family)
MPSLTDKCSDTIGNPALCLAPSREAIIGIVTAPTLQNIEASPFYAYQCPTILASVRGAMEDQWLQWAKRLHAIASTGLHFCKDDFDRERYVEIAAVAQSMLASLGNIPIRRIEGLFSDFSKGYATPKIDVRGAIIEDGKVLLVRERSDGLWTLPGGFADVGLSATENIVKEIQEEAGIRTSVTSLYSVRHKAKHAYEPDIRDFYKMFFLCRRVGVEPPKPGPEVMDAVFFTRDRLPQLSKERVIERDIEAAFIFHESPEQKVVVD